MSNTAINNDSKEEVGVDKTSVSAPLGNRKERIAALNATLARADETTAFRLTPIQKRWVQLWIQACLGADASAAAKNRVQVVAPPLTGKTRTMEIFLAAYMWTQGDSEVMMFTVGRRSCRQMLQRVQVLCLPALMPSGEDCTVVCCNSEVLTIRTASGGTSTLRAFPCGGRALRGLPTQCDLLVLDDPQLFSDEVVVRNIRPRLKDPALPALSVHRPPSPHANASWGPVCAEAGFDVRTYRFRDFLGKRVLAEQQDNDDDDDDDGAVDAKRI